MAAEKTFAEGVFVAEKTFDWGSIITASFKVDEFVAFLNKNKNAKGYVNLNLKKSKAGDKMYAEIDTWVPKTTASNNAPSNDPNDLPF